MAVKKIFWSIIIGIIALTIGTIIMYLQMHKNVRVEKNGFSFSYPNTTLIQEVPSTEGNYANYQVRTPNIHENGSSIMISLPLKSTSIAFTLADNIEPYGNPADIKTATLSGHQGQTITYRQDSNLPGDSPVHAVITYEQYVSRYETSPLMARYFRDDQDASLDAVWKSIRNSISY